MDLTTHARLNGMNTILSMDHELTTNGHCKSDAPVNIIQQQRVAKSVFSIRSLVDLQDESSAAQQHENMMNGSNDVGSSNASNLQTGNLNHNLQQQQIDVTTSESNYSSRTG